MKSKFYFIVWWSIFSQTSCRTLKVERGNEWWISLTMDWYLLQTKPNAQRIAYEHLKRQGFEVFLPLINKTIKKNRKFLDIQTPLFPGYLFMGALLNPVPWKSVNGTKGVSKVVTLDGVYRPVSTHIIEGLQRRCDKDGVFQRLNDIVPGDRVKIETGPFAEFICSVEEIQDYRRAWVLIDVLQNETRSEISLDSVSKIN